MAILAKAFNPIGLLALVASVAALPAPQQLANSSTNAQPSMNLYSSTSTQPSQNLCGNDQHIILDGTPWLVANSLYGAAQMVGSACTYFDRVEAPAGGNPQVVWKSTTSIQNIESTNNVCKGYSNIGLISNLENTISSIASIPATYDWTRTSSDTFKGNICFDFIMGDTKGDSTSTAAQELMLWLEWEGGQLPIGWDKGPAATIDSLFGTSWKLYEDVNHSNGMTVHSLLPDTQFSGNFAGDLKEWFEALVGLGRFTDATYVNIGNAGSELFYGDSTLEASLGLQINLS